MSPPNDRLVTSPGNVYYLRPEVGSRWLGPPDDRVWVPAMDWPDGMVAPPDPESATRGLRTPRAPDNRAVVTSTPSTQYVAPAPPPYQHTTDVRRQPDYGPFSRGASAPQFLGPALGRGTVPPGISSRKYDGYTGPFAQTMRGHDRAMARRYDDDRRWRDGPPHGEEPNSERRTGAEPQRRQEGGHVRDRTGPRHNESYRQQSGGPERAREQQLRNCALHSRAPPGVKPKIQITRPVPDVDGALRRPDGHPVPPVGVTSVEEEESDYGSSGAEDNSELLKFRTREHDRLAKALAKKGGGVVADPLPRAPREAGLWGELPVDTVPQARNLRRRRSDGILYILRHVSAANQGFISAATGDSTPISRRDPNTVSRQERRRITNERLRRRCGGPARSGTSDTPTTESSFDFDEPMRPQTPPAAPPVNPVPEAQWVQSYSGTSPIPQPGPGSMTTHWLGPQLSLHDAMEHAATVPAVAL
ncbi:hypothetical protein K438DRAFT_1960592 [Mycena galopus ATCC 62051]|nr:hypothetical protein K438DRAFT_1960592 [Mycena galopus ATCC 62051]